MCIKLSRWVLWQLWVLCQMRLKLQNLSQQLHLYRLCQWHVLVQQQMHLFLSYWVLYVNCINKLIAIKYLFIINIHEHHNKESITLPTLCHSMHKMLQLFNPMHLMLTGILPLHHFMPTHMPSQFIFLLSTKKMRTLCITLLNLHKLLQLLNVYLWLLALQGILQKPMCIRSFMSE